MKFFKTLRREFNPFDYKINHKDIRRVFKRGSVEYSMAYQLFILCPAYSEFEYVDITSEHEYFEYNKTCNVFHIHCYANIDKLLCISLPAEYLDLHSDISIITKFKLDIVDPIVNYESKIAESEKRERAELDRLIKKYGIPEEL